MSINCAKINRARSEASRRGLTLVEMLVAMTVSLLMIFGLVLAFEKIGNEITDGRAIIEMANQGRTVSHRLRDDLAGVTVPVRPWTGAEPPQGYFEYVDGPANDDPSSAARMTIVGDLDDVIMFTTRNPRTPFVGEVGGVVLQSNVAEVVWFTRWVEEFRGVANQVDPFEVSLHRRALLIRPDLGGDLWWSAPDPANPFHVYCTSTFNVGGYQIPSQLPDLRVAMMTFNQNCDISVRWHVEIVAGGVICLPVPNALSDLGKRENRYCHFPVLYTDPANPTNVVCLPERVASGSAWPVDFPLPVYPFEVVHELYGTPAGRVAAATTIPSLATFLMSGARTGQDLMMENLLAFDVAAYDPLAPLTADSSSRALGTGDPGFAIGGVVGRGDYVDLGYRWRAAGPTPAPLNPAIFQSHFSEVPLYGNLPANASPVFPAAYPGGFPAPFAGRPRSFSQFTYDTLTMEYESDAHKPRIFGLSAPSAAAMADQDGDGLIDEMTNGWDDDGNFAIDDDGEREAPSPYGDPLRGIKVTIRFNEIDTRQVRQTSVISNFTPD